MRVKKNKTVNKKGEKWKDNSKEQKISVKILVVIIFYFAAKINKVICYSLLSCVI